MIWFIRLFSSFQGYQTSLSNTEFTFKRWLEKDFPPKKHQKSPKQSNPPMVRQVLTKKDQISELHFHKTVSKQVFHPDLGRECHSSSSQTIPDLCCSQHHMKLLIYLEYNHTGVLFVSRKGMETVSYNIRMDQI